MTPLASDSDTPPNADPKDHSTDSDKKSADKTSSTGGPSIVTAKATTPMMAQYLTIKSRVPDALLFYRMGDFYELFFEDAQITAKALDITLTKRGKHQGAEIPMCGVPFHAYENYLARLIRQGYTVAMCEQMEAPEEAKKRGSKSVVARDIVRIVTPGTLTEDTLLDSRQNNFLTALSTAEPSSKNKNDAAIAYIDLSTGEFFVRSTKIETIRADLASIQVGELIVSDAHYEQNTTPDHDKSWPNILSILTDSFPISYQPHSSFSTKRGERDLCERLRVASLDAFGSFTPVQIAAMGAALAYLDLTQAGKVPSLQNPKRQQSGHLMAIDAPTRQSLEIVETQSGSRKGSLIHTVDRTITGAGARLLSTRIAAPLTDPDEINKRYDEIAYFIDAQSLCENIRKTLKELPDIIRAMQRLSLERGGPRDLKAIAIGLEKSQELARLIDQFCKQENNLSALPDNLKQNEIDLDARKQGGFTKLLTLLTNSLQDDVPALARDGNFIRKGFDPALDNVCTLRDESRRIIANLEAQYRSQTNIKNLKIKQNNVLGFFVEVNANNGDVLMSAPHNDSFIHRQTLANAVRFTTTELADLDSKISRARDEALARELAIYSDLVEAILDHAEHIRTSARAVAEIDVACSIAVLSREELFIRPVVDTSLAFAIKSGRHPVVEQALRKSSGTFIANDCVLQKEDNAELWLVTGPNMAGKSTFLRQNALITILAQAGCFVPAQSAHIGICDRLFSRVGAADDLARGRSTFMVEMVEAAAILNQAGARALVILDEIGRGTSTFDGLSIAWACLEHLHDRNRCRGLFATHYHELTALEGQLARLRNVSMKVREWKGDVIFLHEVGPGTADRSYGVAVAKLAGMPDLVTRRAEAVLKTLENQKHAQEKIDTLPLFSATQIDEPKSVNDTITETKLSDALSDIQPDTLSPRQALEALYQLKALGDDNTQ